VSIKKVRRGDSLLPHLTADWYNQTVDARKDDIGPASAADASVAAGNGCRVRIQNNTGNRLDRYSIVGLDANVFDPSYGGQSLTSFKNQVLIGGSTPSYASHAYRFAVLLESCASGRNAEALIIGAVPVQVYVTNTSHTYADVTTGSTDYLTSQSVGGAKLLMTPTYTGLQWCVARVGLVPPASQNYVEYTLDNALVGFANSALKLDSSTTVGWSGSLYRAGSESSAGIEYQSSETSPNVNGLYKATTDGLFRITLSGYYKLFGTAYPSAATQDVVTTGPASAGTAHTHSVTQTGLDKYILNTGPQINIRLYNKPSGSGIGIAADASGRFFEFYASLPTTGSTRYLPVNAQWNVCLSQNDKLSLRWEASGMTNHYWTIDGDPIKLRFEYIGGIQNWSVI
jgi:hypothetical protein